VNAITPAFAFDLASERFDTYVAQSFAATKASRHVRDRLIAQVDAGTVDHMLLRAKMGLGTLPDAVNRQAALNVIDFHFEPLVMPSMAVSQATAYLRAVEDTLQVREASGLDAPGPLWVDTVHHVCVFSVLFQLAAFLGRERGFDRIILLHQGQRPEPRLGIVTNLLRRVHGIALVSVPLQGPWLAKLGQLATPNTAIFYLSDMPPGAFGGGTDRKRSRSTVTLYSAPDTMFRVATVSGSTILARRLGAAQIALDYPDAGGIRITPHPGEEESLLCPLEDWIFWPLLGTSGGRSADALSRD
jgi:hypothetical protein